MSIAFSGESEVMGNRRTAHGTVTLTNQASGAVQIPGVGLIKNAIVAPGESWAGATYAVAINKASGGTAQNGSLRIKSATSGDIFSVYVVGQ